MTYRSDILATSGLLGYWPLNESGGTTATDLVSGNNGTRSGATPGATGIVTNTGDTCYSFDGASDVVTVGVVPAFSTDNASVEAWFSYTGSWTGAAVIVAYRVVAGGAGGWTLQAGAANTFDWYVSATGTGFATLNTSGWSADTVYHIVCTYDGHKHKVYRNGSLIGTAVPDYNGVIEKPASLSLQIGMHSTQNISLHGSIADVSIYSSVLDASTIAAHYASGIAAAPATDSSRINTQFQLRPY